jgi:HTH-type transcriptional regulator, competence development regulator
MAEKTILQKDDSNLLGRLLRNERERLEMSLRDVEEATDGEVSNAYLSQLETGKIAKPSPHVLYALAEAMGISYDQLMKKAGYIVSPKKRKNAEKHGRVATFAVENLTPEEETELRDYLSFIRSKRKK